MKKTPCISTIEWHRSLQVFLIAGLLLVLNACAHSPQQLTVTPELAMSAESIGNNRPLRVSAEDRRETKTIGNRGGVYATTSTIAIQDDIDQSILDVSKARLAVMGFNVNTDLIDSASINVVLEDISYQPIEQAVGNKVVIQTVMLAELSRGGERYSGRYSSKIERQSLFTPNAKTNTRVISDLISNTLERMFADPKLQSFLGNI